MSTPDVSVIVLAHGEEPLLTRCVDSILASRTRDGAALDLELLVVDNDATAAVSALERHPRIHVLSPGRNTGFAGGCNAGARAARAGVLVFLNSDALVEPDAIATLAEACRRPGSPLVCGSVRLLDRPDVMNSAGNPVHFLGVAWSGGHGEPAEQHQLPRSVTALTGAFFAVERTTWTELGGFFEAYFAYHEDVELSLRAWQRGIGVQYVPAAVALHDYVFSRNARKYYLLERNRWLTILTVYPRAVLTMALPALLVFEVAMCLRALVQGWMLHKLHGYAWLLRHRATIAERRRAVQGGFQLTQRQFAELLEPRLAPSVLGPLPGLPALNVVLAAYWRAAMWLWSARERSVRADEQLRP